MPFVLLDICILATLCPASCSVALWLSFVPLTALYPAATLCFAATLYPAATLCPATTTYPAATLCPAATL
jgi:hypothetical protein